MRPRGQQHPLRVRFVVADHVVPAWIALLLDQVVVSPSLDLVDVMVAGEQPKDVNHAGGVAWRMLVRADAGLFGRRVRYLAPVDLRTWSGDWRCRRADNQDSPDRGAATPAPRIDLSVHLTCSPPQGAQDRGARVWWLTGVPATMAQLDAELPLFQAEAISRARIASFELTERRRGQREWCVIYEGQCPAHPSSGLMTAEHLAASALQLLAECLRSEASAQSERRGDIASRFGRPPCLSGGKAGRRASVSAPGLPSASSTVRFGALTAARRFRDTFMESRWELLVGQLSAGALLPEPQSLMRLTPPRGRFWADPFVLDHHGEVLVFFEEFVYETRKGRISVISLSQGVGNDSVSLAIEKASHLSYPCVFQHDGRYFMVPENASAGCLDLFECVELPDRWEFRRRVADVPFVDATIFPWDGLWWMFASLKRPSSLPTADLLVLYVTDDPVEGSWRRHPASPLLADATRARPAGTPFVVDGRLYRVGQDASGGYGWGMSISEVTTLTPDTYREVAVTSIVPEFDTGICGTHTFNRAGNMVVADVCRRVVRDPRRPPAQNLSA